MLMKFAQKFTRFYKRRQIRSVLANLPMEIRDDIGITQYEIDKIIADIK